jgi:hypothetical protein
MPGETDELVTPNGQDLLHRPFHDTLREMQALGDLSAMKPAGVKRRHVALALGEALEDDAGDARDLGIVFPPDRGDLSGRRAGIVDLQLVHRDIGEALALESTPLMSDLTMCSRTKPVVDLALHLADTGALGTGARLLEGILDLFEGRVGVPPRHLRPQPPTGVAAGDLLEQRRASSRDPAGVRSKRSCTPESPKSRSWPPLLRNPSVR